MAKNDDSQRMGIEVSENEAGETTLTISAEFKPRISGSGKSVTYVWVDRLPYTTPDGTALKINCGASRDATPVDFLMLCTEDDLCTRADPDTFPPKGYRGTDKLEPQPLAVQAMEIVQTYRAVEGHGEMTLPEIGAAYVEALAAKRAAARAAFTAKAGSKPTTPPKAMANLANASKLASKIPPKATK